MPEPVRVPERRPGGDRDGIVARFFERFGGRVAPKVFWAPGRVNLIGDHIDYCGGAVLPMPIQFGTTVAVRLNDCARVRGASLNTPEFIDLVCADPAPLPIGSWGRFLSGAIAVLADEGIEIPGVDVMVRGAIPGSGLSSSASLGVVLLHALSHLVARPIAPLSLALAAQRVEHEHVGVHCGLMDQAVIALAEPGCALLFDCLDHTHRSIPLDDASVSLVVADTGCVRQLVHSAYNERRGEIEVAARALGADFAAFARLGARRLEAGERNVPDVVVRRRARHVVSEAARVGAAAVALESHDWTVLGELLSSSHESLRSDFEVSCPELDVLSSALARQPGCYGARMTGAGFGGSVVALLDTTAIASAMARVCADYAAQFGAAPAWFTASSLGGVRSLDG